MDVRPERDDEGEGAQSGKQCMSVCTHEDTVRSRVFAQSSGACREARKVCKVVVRSLVSASVGSQPWG